MGLRPNRALSTPPSLDHKRQRPKQAENRRARRDLLPSP